MEPLEADAKAAEEAAAPMASLKAEELKAFATPATVLEKVEKLAASVKEKADAAKESIEEQLKKAAEVTPATAGIAEAKKQLNSMKGRMEQLAKKTLNMSNSLKSKSQTLIGNKMEAVAEAIRKLAQSKNTGIEELFDSLAKGDKIPEADFCKMLESLDFGEDGTPLSPEIAKLVCRKMEADGVSKETFKKHVVMYFKVVKSIAFMDGQDIQTCKTLRKAEEGEILEVLEGPVHDEGNSMTKVRARACKEPHTTGWVTVAGSMGSTFLQKCKAPAAPKA